MNKEQALKFLKIFEDEMNRANAEYRERLNSLNEDEFGQLDSDEIMEINQWYEDELEFSRNGLSYFLSGRWV